MKLFLRLLAALALVTVSGAAQPVPLQNVQRIVGTNQLQATTGSTTTQVAVTQFVTTIATLRIFSVTSLSSGTTVSVDGYASVNDGGGGLFVWDSTSTTTDNGGTVIQSTGVTLGRWFRLYVGTVNVKWFGAKGDGLNDDATAINHAIAASLSVTIPAGTFVVGSPVYTRTGLTLTGAGKNNTVIQAATGFSGLSGVLRCSISGSTPQNNDDVTISNLTVDANKAGVSSIDMDPFYFQGGTPSRGSRLAFYGCKAINGNNSVDGGIGFGVGGYDYVRIDSCDAYDNENNGFDINNSTKVIITNCRSVGNAIDSFFMGHGSTDCTLASSYGSSVGQGLNIFNTVGNTVPARMIVVGNILKSSTEHGLYMDSTTNGVISGNQIVGSGVAFKYGILLQSFKAALPISMISIVGNSFSNVYLPVFSEGAVTGVTYDGNTYLNGSASSFIATNSSSVMTWPTSTDANLAAGSSGATLTLVSGTNGGVAVTMPGNGNFGVSTTVPNALMTLAPRKGSAPTNGSIVTGLSIYNAQANTLGDGVKILFDHSFGTPGNQTRGASISSKNDITGFSTDVGFVFATTTSGSAQNSMTLSSSGSLTLVGAVSVGNTTAIIYSGTGSPESAIVAPVGSLFLRTDGGASTTLYVKQSGAGNTGWVGK